jgi:hypothetical protein
VIVNMHGRTTIKIINDIFIFSSLRQILENGFHFVAEFGRCYETHVKVETKILRPPCTYIPYICM